MSKNIIIYKNFLWIENNGEKYRLSRYIGVKEVLHNIDDKTFKANLEFLTLNGISNIIVDRDICLTKNKLMDLQSKGLDVVSSNVNDLIEYLRECEYRAIKKNVHSKLGFFNYNGNEIYKLYNTVGIKSEYVGEYDVKPKGSKEKYIEMLEAEVFGKCELEFAIVSALSAVTLGYIGEELGLDSLLIHLVGNSTTGKSTALKLAISCFGYPDVKRNGLYSTYNSTNNAILKKLTGLKGVPLALDEISMSYTNNFTNFVYSVANGTDKDRLNKDSELKGKETWLTTILSNGERSLISSSNKNAGVQIRVIEIDNVTWTRDAENAENIKEAILENYGHIGFEFAKFVMQKGKETLIKQFKEIKKAFKYELEQNQISDNMIDRRCEKYAIILQTAYLFSEMMNVQLKIKEIKEMLIEVERKSIKNRNFKESAIDYIKQYVEKYKNKFETDDNTNSSKDILGKLSSKSEYVEVQMNRISFDNMLKEGGFEDSTVVLKELKASGFLNCESDRYTRSRKNEFGTITEYIVVKLNKDKPNLKRNS
ncbi:DUF927 domain-containing protein [Clostridium perfringens]|nr:DUF927 domain-containing protein [Clostridium perfringens]MDK0665664.1 DUF927 domain-containing protein [Clostridium perfringens]